MCLPSGFEDFDFALTPPTFSVGPARFSSVQPGSGGAYLFGAALRRTAVSGTKLALDVGYVLVNISPRLSGSRSRPHCPPERPALDVTHST